MVQVVVFLSLSLVHTWCSNNSNSDQSENVAHFIDQVCVCRYLVSIAINVYLAG